MIITIDGPVATGKSTIARKLAESLGFIYFDTGAMYRAVTYSILKEDVDTEDTEALDAFLSQFDFDIKIRRGHKHYYVNDEDVTTSIRSIEVTQAVSHIAAIKAVRNKLVAIQRQFAVGVNAVFEGRDMGTVVFPDADLKIYLTGSIEVRAQRRFEEIQRERPEEADGLTLDEVKQDVEERDHSDMTRDISPLSKAKDAYTVDTTDLTLDEVVFQIFECKDRVKSRSKQS